MIQQTLNPEIKLSISVTFLTGILAAFSSFLVELHCKLQLKKARALFLLFNDASNRVGGIERCY